MDRLRKSVLNAQPGGGDVNAALQQAANTADFDLQAQKAQIDVWGARYVRDRRECLK